jgi:glucose-6-phosphate dehydrogenase assembly protein OpcA
MAAALAPEKILKELAGLWLSLGKQGQEEAGAGVLRACTMTLVVLSGESDDTAALGETIAALMPEHPARAIVIRLGAAGSRELSSRVYAQCWMPFGQRRQICCEQIEITAGGETLGDLPPVVRPLAAPDLPLVLWCRSLRVAAMPQFRPVAAMADKTILDTTEAARLPLLAELSAQGIVLGDLAWTRLTRWRETLARVFDNRSNLELLPRVSSVRVAFSDPEESTAWYMAAWLEGTLAAAGVRPAVSVSKRSPDSPLEVELAGEGVALRLRRESERLVVTINGASTCASLTRPSDYLLMREELGILRRDPVFETALASAVLLSSSANP